jgi:aldehyde:ferredoxin oxidoreductase
MQTSRTVDLDADLAKGYIGGRAMGVKMLMDEFGSSWTDLDPLSPEAPFILTVGPLNGYCAGKTNSTIKSPLSGSAMAAQISGDMNAAIRFAGYDGIIIRGKADTPVYLYIHDDRVEFRDARSLWGMTTRETHRLLLADTDPMTQFLYIGPAGEKKVKIAVVMANWYKALARGGSGAVWGAKNLKAMAVKGTKPAPAVDDIGAMTRMLRHIHKVNPSRSPRMHEYGTARGTYTTGFEESAEPVRNWQEEWHDEKAIKGEFFAAEQWQRRYWADYACTLACCKIGRIKQGKHTGEITELPDYEGGAFCGPNFAIYNIQDIPHLCDVFDQVGIDVISGGSVLGWAAELYQRGILTKADLEVDLNWGDAEAFEHVIHMVAERRGVGDTLAEGTLIASKIIGQNSYDYAVQTKGIELGAHGVRSGIDYTRDLLSYAMSTQGGDHTSIAELDFEPSILEDSLVLCSFWRATPEEVLQLLEASTGLGITQEEMTGVYLKRWTTLQRMTQLLAGWTHEDDTNPPRFYEPLPNGPYKGLRVERAAEQQRVQECYRARGYDRRGIPTPETLEKLGLQEFDELLVPIRST